MAPQVDHRSSRLALCLFVCCCGSLDDPRSPSLTSEAGAGGISSIDEMHAQAGASQAGQPDSETGGSPAPDEPDHESPRLVSSVPRDGDENVAWASTPHLVFSEPVVLTKGAVVLRQAEPARLIPVSATVGADPRSIDVALDDAPDVPSELILELGSGIADLAGNPLEPTAVRFALPTWLRLGAELNRDRSVSATEVRLARDSTDAVVMLSVEGGDVYASRYTAGAWQPLGEALNQGLTRASPDREPRIALAVDSTDAPLAAFREDDAVVALRWDGDAWQPLGHLVDQEGGGGYPPALGFAENGEPVIAFDGFDVDGQPSLRVRTLTKKGWLTLLDLPGATQGVRLAGDGQQPFTLAYRQASGELWAKRWDGSGLSTLGGASALGAGGGSIALSVNGATTVVSAQGRGSARLEAGAWQPVEPDMGFLDSSAAGHRSLLHASDGALLAVFAETTRGEVASRVYAQRLSEGRFMPLGPALNRNREAAADSPALAVGIGGEPIVAFLETTASSAPAQIYAARYNGDPGEPPVGLKEASHTEACLAQPPLDGSKLVDTGCFADAIGREPVTAFVPFDVVSPLWSDGASKRRFFMLPGDESITYRDPGIWTFPPGSILIKEFAIEGRRGDPSTVRPVETRLLVVRGTGEWDRYSYQWNQEATEAVLRAAIPATPLVKFSVQDEQGAAIEQVHFYPSRAQCLSCHQTPGTVLGLQAAMLNRNIDYGVTVDNQLRTLARRGAFGTTFTAASLRGASFMPDPSDGSYATESRLRAYLHANCSSCHHPFEGLDLRIQTPTLQSGLCSKITKGNPEDSLIYWRDVLRGNVGQPGVAPMPPLGTLVPNPLLEPLLRDWISDPRNPCP